MTRIITKLNDSVWECNLINKLSKENKTRRESVSDFGSGYDCRLEKSCLMRGLWHRDHPHSSDCTGKTQSGIETITCLTALTVQVRQSGIETITCLTAMIVQVRHRY